MIERYSEINPRMINNTPNIKLIRTIGEAKQPIDSCHVTKDGDRGQLVAVTKDFVANAGHAARDGDRN